MNYKNHHDRLIARARDRVLTGYKERHHIVPRCMGGDDSPANLVDLTPEEHYVAHQLLVKMHPGVYGLALAATRMAKQCTGNKPFGWLRRLAAAANTGRKMPLEQRERLRITSTGKKHTAAARLKMSMLASGKKKSPAHAQKIKEVGAKRRGVPLSLETRSKMSASRMGIKRPKSAEHRAKLSAALRGKKWTAERKARLSASLMGKPPPVNCKGGKWSPERHIKGMEAWEKRRQKLMLITAPFTPPVA